MYSSKFNLIVLIILFSVSSLQLSAKEKWWEKVVNKAKTSESLTANNGEITDAFKQALQIASESVVNNLGVLDGFNSDPSIHIPLPKNLKKVKKLLSKVGKSSMVNDLEMKLNRAAETATPKAKKLFIDAITAMSFDDIQKIYNGPKDSATQYFKNKLTPTLSAEMRPVIDQQLAEVGAIKSFDRVMSKYKSLPLVPDIKSDLSAHVLDKALAGIFYYMGKEEAAIRDDPLKQTTELLKKVFGN